MPRSQSPTNIVTSSSGALPATPAILYRFHAETAPDYVDFWSGALFRELKDGLFPNLSDLAMFLSTRGVKVFKSRKPVYTQQITLVCYNLLPWTVQR